MPPGRGNWPPEQEQLLLQYVEDEKARLQRERPEVRAVMDEVRDSLPVIPLLTFRHVASS